MFWEPTPDYLDNDRVVFAAKVASWMESYVFIRTKTGQVVRLQLNAVQLILMQFVAWRWARALPAKPITPKSRQQGSSTFWEALEYALAELVPGYQAIIVAHHSDALPPLLKKVHTIKECLSRTPFGGSRLKNDQQGVLYWVTDSCISSGVITTGDALGKAPSPNAVHFSEVASFEDKGNDPTDAITSILNAMGESPWTLEVYESTAKGKDSTFYRRCEQAKDPHSQSDLTLIFLPWFLTPEYAMSWREFRARQLSSGKDDPGSVFVLSPEETHLRSVLDREDPAPHERAWRYRTYLRDEQLIWRRWSIANKCDGNIHTFQRYYPSFYHECFVASVNSAFSAETIEYYKNAAKEPMIRGVLRATKFAPDPHGSIRLWAYPQPGIPYLIGTDPGGDRQLAGADPSCAYVMNRLTREVVASLHGWPYWEELVDLLFNLGVFYNNAFLIVENNYNPAVANTLHQRGYPNLCYYFAENKIQPTLGKVPGWSTNKKTRKELVAAVTAHAKARTFECPDSDLWMEMESFVWVPAKTSKRPDMEGEYRAIGRNKDDRIIALALCLFHVLLPFEQPPTPDTPPQLESRAYQYYRAHLQGVEPHSGPVLL